MNNFFFSIEDFKTKRLLWKYSGPDDLSPAALQQVRVELAQQAPKLKQGISEAISATVRNRLVQGKEEIATLLNGKDGVDFESIANLLFPDKWPTSSKMRALQRALLPNGSVDITGKINPATVNALRTQAGLTASAVVPAVSSVLPAANVVKTKADVAAPTLEKSVSANVGPQERLSALQAQHGLARRRYDELWRGAVQANRNLVEIARKELSIRQVAYDEANAIIMAPAYVRLFDDSNAAVIEYENLKQQLAEAPSDVLLVRIARVEEKMHRAKILLEPMRKRHDDAYNALQKAKEGVRKAESDRKAEEEKLRVFVMETLNPLEDVLVLPKTTLPPFFVPGTWGRIA